MLGSEERQRFSYEQHALKYCKKGPQMYGLQKVGSYRDASVSLKTKKNLFYPDIRPVGLSDKGWTRRALDTSDTN